MFKYFQRLQLQASNCNGLKVLYPSTLVFASVTFLTRGLDTYIDKFLSSKVHFLALKYKKYSIFNGFSC